MAFQLSLRPQTLTKLCRIRPLSSSTPPDSSAAISDPSSAAAPPPPPSFDSHLRDIKDRLRSPPPCSIHDLPLPPPRPTGAPAPAPASSLVDICKHLAEFPNSSRSPSSSPPTLSFQNLFKKMHLDKPSAAAADDPKRTAHSFDSTADNWFSIAELNDRLVKLHELEEKELDSMMGGEAFRGLWGGLEKFKMELELQKFRDKFKFKMELELQKVRDKFKFKMELELQKVRDKFKMSESDCGSTRVQEVGNKPSSQSVLNAILTDEKSTDDAKPKDPKTEFLPMYSYKELEEKLRRIRPEVGDNWFSIAELNDQLVKLYELEEEELDSMMGGEDCRVLRESLLGVTEADLKKKAAACLNRLSAIMSKHPQDELLETFKKKLEMMLEFQKVREEFKMSDKPARKRLNEMVQKRKELLADLFWTDRVSYFVLLLEIGLFDSPEYKASNYKTKP